MTVFSRSWLRPSASVRSVITLGALFMIAVQAMTGFEIWRQYSNAITVAERNINLLADVLAGEVGRAVTAVDAVVERTTIELSSTTARPPEETRRVMRDRATGIPQIFGLMVVDNDGNTIASLHAPSPRHASFVNTIRANHDGSDLPVHIGLVGPAPFDGTPIIPFSRFRLDANGNIAGMTIAAMSAQYFQELFLQVKSLPGAHLTLARRDGGILAQTPEGTGATMASMPEFQPNARDNGLLHGEGENSGRIVAFRTLRPYGLKLSVAVDASDLLVSWRSNALRLLLAAMFGALVLTAMIALMLRGLARDEERLNSLRESERSRRMAQFSLDNCADMVVWSDDQGRIVFANKAIHDRLAYDDQTLLGKSVGDIDPNFPQSDWRRRMAELRKARNLRIESCLRDSTGQLIPAEVSVNIFHLDGQDYTCAIIRDTIERKQAETVLAERSQRLEASNAELEQFAYVASHDLREPLRMISSFVGLLARQFGPQLPPEAREYVEFAREGAMRMDRLILDLLEYSRVGTTGRPLAAIALSQVVANVRHNLSVDLNEAHARLSVPAALPVVWGDEDELGRLLTNLIGNALKYRHPDRAPEIELIIQSQDEQITCLVRDNGIGIAPQYFDRIFRIFQRLHNRDRYDGTGIGLAICKKIVERHGGRIWLSSSPDHGTTFFFTLKPPPKAIENQ